MKFTNVDCREAQKIYETAKDDYVWLDVRTQAEYDDGHIPGIKLIPVDELEERIQEVGPKDKKYIICCHSGRRSAAACEILSEKGYRSVFNISGGMSQWQGPMEKNQ